MKKYLLLFTALLPVFAFAQKLEPMDSLTAESIFKKHLKVVFLTRTEKVKRYYCGTPDLIYPGDKAIRNLTPGMGKWYLRPDYTLQQEHLDTLYAGFSTLYKLEIPDSTPRNDSIAGYNVYRVYYEYQEPDEEKKIYVWKRRMEIGYLFEPWKSLTACLWLGQNAKDKDDYAYLNDYSLSGIINKKSVMDSNYKKYGCKPVRSKEKYPVLAPRTDEEIKNFLKSELTKNIYAYRIIKAGLLDSLCNIGKYSLFLKENINLFSYVDKLLPDMDCELALRADKYDRGSLDPRIKLWRFFYPGVDYIIHPNGDVVRDTTWNQYFPLKPQFYVIGYDTKRELVHFLGGDDFFKTKNYYNDSESFSYYLGDKIYKNDSIETGFYRRYYVEDKIIRAYHNYYPYIRYDEDLMHPDGEDEEYWYYKMTNSPRYVELTEDIFNQEDSPNNWFILKEEICDYYIRMSKKDYNIVEIYKKENCKTRRRNESNFVVPDNKDYVWKSKE